MTNTENKNHYISVKEVSNDIYRVAELGEQLKSLYFNQENSDPSAIQKLETEYSDRKINIIEYLRDPIRYDMFRTSPDSKQSLFMKKVKEGYYDKELGLEDSLKEKIYHDFLDKFNQTSPEILMTPQEKRNIQMLQQLSIEGAEPRGLEEETKILLTVHSRTRVFKSNWDYVISNLPGKELLDMDAKKLLKIVQENPHFLQDNPNHFLKNKGSFFNQAPDLEKFNDAIHNSSLGTSEAKEKVKKYIKLFQDFSDKKPEAESIKEIREQSLQNKIENKNTQKPAMGRN